MKKSVSKNANRHASLIRICFVSHSAYMGGAERAMLEAIKALTLYGIECFVLLPYDGPLRDELNKLGIISRIIKYKPWMGSSISHWTRLRDLLISLWTVISILSAILRWKVDLVYTNTITIYAGAIAAFLSRRPHVWHLHEFGFEDHGIDFIYGQRLSLSIINRFNDLCIAASRAIMEKFRQLLPEAKIVVAYQSVSVAHSTARPKLNGSPSCVIVGKVSEGKRQEDAVRAIGELSNAGVRAELYIIGDGFPDYQARLREIVEAYNIEHSVHFIKYTDMVFGYMESADIILMCSRAEAFGRVTIEGMKAGKPVIGARSGATAELIQDGVTGFLYTPGDYSELGRGILYLYEHPSEAKMMGEAARLWASERFTLERYGQELAGLLLPLAQLKQKR